MTKKVVTYQLVKIKWLDSASHDGWEHEEDIAKLDTGMECITIGFLVRKPTKKSPVYFVASTVSVVEEGEQTQASCIMKIPTVCVVEIEKLENVY